MPGTEDPRRGFHDFQRLDSIAIIYRHYVEGNLFLRERFQDFQDIVLLIFPMI